MDQENGARCRVTGYTVHRIMGSNNSSSQLVTVTVKGITNHGELRDCPESPGLSEFSYIFTYSITYPYHASSARTKIEKRFLYTTILLETGPC